MRPASIAILLTVLLVGPTVGWAKTKKSSKKLTPIERYIQEAALAQANSGPTSGSLFLQSGLNANLARDPRANQLNDIVTIVVYDKASAVSRGTSSSGRKSAADASFTSLAGPTNPGSALANLLGVQSSQQLQGQGETSRENILTTTISARVTHVLPNGYLVLQGGKSIRINSEDQQVSVRGVVRWIDIGPTNTVSSDRLANLEVFVNGEGVVGDAIRRPNFLFRFLLGVLPF